VKPDRRNDCQHWIGNSAAHCYEGWVLDECASTCNHCPGLLPPPKDSFPWTLVVVTIAVYIICFGLCCWKQWIRQRVAPLYQPMIDEKSPPASPLPPADVKPPAAAEPPPPPTPPPPPPKVIVPVRTVRKTITAYEPLKVPQAVVKPIVRHRTVHETRVEEQTSLEERSRMVWKLVPETRMVWKLLPETYVETVRTPVAVSYAREVAYLEYEQVMEETTVQVPLDRQVEVEEVVKDEWIDDACRAARLREASLSRLRLRASGDAIDDSLSKAPFVHPRADAAAHSTVEHGAETPRVWSRLRNDWIPGLQPTPRSEYVASQGVDSPPKDSPPKYCDHKLALMPQFVEACAERPASSLSSIKNTQAMAAAEVRAAALARQFKTYVELTEDELASYCARFEGHPRSVDGCPELQCSTPVMDRVASNDKGHSSNTVTL